MNVNHIAAIAKLLGVALNEKFELKNKYGEYLPFGDDHAKFFLSEKWGLSGDWGNFSNFDNINNYNGIIGGILIGEFEIAKLNKLTSEK